MVQAEEAATADKPGRLPSPEELRKRAKDQEVDGLCNPVSLEIFTTWYSFGGAQRGLSPQEVLDMPAWLRQDFSLIMRYVSEARDNHKRLQPKTPKPTPRRRR